MRMPALGQWEAVRVEWNDTVGVEEGWVALRKKDRIVRGCVTVGQVESMNNDCLTLVFTWDAHTKHAQGVMTIPYVAITNIERLDRD